jgi:hypothetical protein
MAIVGKLIGLACTAIGVFLLWASPFSTVACAHDAAGVSCKVDQSMLGVVPLTAAQVHHILRAEVGRTSPAADPSRPVTETTQRNDTYQLAFITSEGRVAPRGVDAGSSAPLHEVADRVNDLVKGDGGPFTARNYNGFPNVAGSIFLFVGLVMVLFAR